ncbi:glycogenin glucosyltransferase glg1 [Balamuthia mandrillaris]
MKLPSRRGASPPRSLFHLTSLLSLSCLLCLCSFFSFQAAVAEELPPSPPPTSRNAYVMIHYEGTPRDAEYLFGLRVTLRSLKLSKTRQDLVVLVSQNVRQETRQLLEADGALVHTVPDIENSYAHRQLRFQGVLNKLHVWNLTSYERVVYLDSDTIALTNMDELFGCGQFCAVFMNPCNFHTGLIVVKPDADRFADMLTKLKAGLASYDGADQGFLTAYYDFQHMFAAPAFDPEVALKDLHPLDGLPRPSQAPMMRLPPGYNLNALWYYEKGHWNLYQCYPFSEGAAVPGEEGFELDYPPGISMTFPTAPMLKPWYWYPYVALDANWLLWRSIAQEVDDQNSGLAAIIVVFSFLGGALFACTWGFPQHFSGGRFVTLYRTASRYLLQLTGKRLDTLLAISVAVVCVVLSLWLPYLYLPAMLPPVVGWFLLLTSQQLLILCFIVLINSTSALLYPVVAARQHRIALLEKSIKDMTWGIIFLVFLLCIHQFGIYPKHLPFHLGKVATLLFSATFMLILQVNILRRLLLANIPTATSSSSSSSYRADGADGAILDIDSNRSL